MWDMESLKTNQVGKISKYYDLFEMDEFIDKIKPVYNRIYGDGDFIRILIVKLKKHTYIKPHTDNGQSLLLCHRTHIPIITNNMVTFTINDETKTLDEGEIWEINNQLTHSVKNDSDIDRVHLILDYFVKLNKNIKNLI
jgi:quercetin dioxygenase-like cupin family protein